MLNKAPSVMQGDSIIISLDAEEALVLFELLSRWSNDGAPLEVDNMGEKVALAGLLAQLEKQLVVPFRPDYRERLAEALSVLKQRGGGAQPPAVEDRPASR